MPVEPSDLELVRRWREGDTVAGEQLARRCFPIVYRYFQRRVPALADELSQRTFEACLAAVHRFREDGTFRAYLLSIAHNQLVSHWRKARSTPSGRDEVEPLAADDGRSASQVVASHEVQKVMRRALRNIPDPLRDVVELHYWEELSTSEIAQVLGFERSTITSRLLRARDALREQLRNMDINEAVRATTLASIQRRPAPDDA